MSRLDILKASLEKKQARLSRKLNEYFPDVKSTNGQPLNDEKDGYSAMKRWDRQNDILSRMQKEIERTQTAIEREEGRIGYIDHDRSSMLEGIQKLINDGTLKQWNRYPHIMFMEDVDKAHIIWGDRRKVMMHKFVSSITDTEQRRRFARVYNSLDASINEEMGKQGKE